MGVGEWADVGGLGRGPGGAYGAGTPAEAGLDVVEMDRESTGGECLYRGCLPSRIMCSGNVPAEAVPVPSLAGGAGKSLRWVEDAGRSVPVGAASEGPAGLEALSGRNATIHVEVFVERPHRVICPLPGFHRTVEAALKALR